ncbi:PAS domain S-box protein [Sulfurivermis fontis]|uniref:PAS domain S-box protein n=1 Tax=Sulfurivermis fontis TaxID=1972068 RepID=UPI0015597E37|nr:PAS domain S-box protein [Sulfurivermis fontis]
MPRSVVFTLLFGALLSAALFAGVRRYEMQEARFNFERHAASLLESMQRQMDLAVEMVDSFGALYDASDEVSHAEFARFAEARLNRHGEIQALIWVPRVTAAERAAHERGMQAEGFADYRIRKIANGDLLPADESEVYFPVQFAAPLEGNRGALGIDLASHALRRLAMEAARDSGTLVATPMLALLQPAYERQGFLIFRPVYQSVPEPGDVVARRLALRGYVAGVFRIAELMAAVQRAAGTEYLAFELFDARNGRPLFQSLQPAETTAPLRWQGELVLPGRSWRVVFNPGAGHGIGHPMLAWWALGLGVLFTLLLGYHLYSQALRARRLEEANQALELSRELIEHAHHEWMDAFDAVSDPIFLHDADGRVMRANRAYADCAGVDFADIIGRFYWEVFPLDSGPAQACVLARQEVRQMEEEVVAGNGHVYAARFFAIRNDAGDYRYSIHILRDVTEQCAMARRVEEERGRAQRYLDVAAVMLLALDTEGRITLINRKGCEILGYDEQELLGQSWLDKFVSQPGHAQVRAIFADILADKSHPYVESWIVRRSGEQRLIAWHNTVLRDADGKITGTLSSGMDITERHRLEEALRESQSRLQTVFDTARDGILVAELATQRFVLANKAMAEMLGYTEAELYWLKVEDIHPADQLPQVQDTFARQVRGEMAVARDVPLLRHDGRVIYADVSAAPVELDGRRCLLGLFHDTSERRAIEARLAASEEQLALALQGSSDGLWDWNVATGKVFYSTRWKTMLGYHDDEIGDGTGEWRRLVHPDDLPAAEAAIDGVLGGEDDKLQFEVRMRHKDGHWVWIQSRGHVVRDASGKALRLVGTHEDVTGRRVAEERVQELAYQLQERLKESRCLYRVAQLAEETETPLPELLQRAVNYLPEAWQYPELTTARIRYQGQDYLSPGFTAGPASLAALIMVGPLEVGSVEVFYTQALPELDEGPFFKEERELIEAIADQLGQIIGLRIHQQTLNRLNRVLRTLNLSNRALVYTSDERDFEQEICAVLVREAGYRSVWIGSRDVDGVLHTLAWDGEQNMVADNLPCTAHDAVSRLICTALDRGELQRDTLRVGEDCPLCQRSGDDSSAIALPMISGEESLGVLFVCSGQTEPWAPAEVELLQELADDLAYGIRMRRTTGERDRAQAELARILIKTVSVIALTVEKRDPYTAGHMQRVAELAMAIGHGMNLDEGTITGLQMGALIHDIGKIYIPAEILNRPGRLAPVEFDLIKTHPQVGYDIVKEIDFPWPVAEMILQHHERIDGSGYPNGLRGNAIGVEARILAVADVVEAMASHRPYRASLPLQAALDEIEQHQGSRYDPAVVQVCLRLFREQGFTWRGEEA